ncbi:MAG TPA: hypothetical protein VE996_13075 [Terriglobales bacterium]|nr:hypothetical protein [Terriglobales bacterium]
MAKPQPSGFAALRSRLQELGFEILDAGENRYFAVKYGCAAGLTADEQGQPVLFASPGRIVRGELARLIDRSFQKFLKTADGEWPARAEDLGALHDFQRDLHYAAGTPLLYNEALGSVSDRYLYDRIWYRDQGAQPRPWEDARRRLPDAELADAQIFKISAGVGGVN